MKDKEIELKRQINFDELMLAASAIYGDITEEQIKTYIEKILRKNSDMTGLQMAMANLIQKDKWAHGFAPADNDGYANMLWQCIYNNTVSVEGVKSESLKEAYNFLAFGWVTSIPVLLIEIYQIMNGSITKEVELHLWRLFAVANEFTDSMIMRLEIRSPELGGNKVFPNPQYMDKKHSKGGLKSSERYHPIKEWCMAQEKEIRNKNPNITDHALAKKIALEKYQKAPPEIRILSVGEEINTFYKWIRMNPHKSAKKLLMH